LLARANLNEPAPSLRLHYRGIITTTGRSASEFRTGTPRLTISVAKRSPSRRLLPQKNSQQAPLSEPAFPRSVQKPQNRLAPPSCRAPPGQ